MKPHRTLTELERKALTLIRREEGLSRAELSRALAVSRPTASLLAEKLLQKQAICETGRGKIRRGKSPVLLGAVPSYQYTVGLDLGYTKDMVGVLLSGTYQIVRKAQAEFNSGSPDDIARKAGEMVRQLSGGYAVEGIGVALSGIVEPGTGKVLRSVNPVFSSCDMGNRISQQTKRPVIVENRSRAAAFSEAFGGAATRQDHFTLISLGKSIGATFWLKGEILQGSGGAAGEIRSLRLADGRTLEEALSFDAADRCSEEERVSLCAEGLYQLAEIMDLDFFVLTGRFTDFGAVFPKELTRKLSLFRPCRAVFSDYGKFSAARGASMAAAEHFLAAQGRDTSHPHPQDESHRLQTTKGQ